MKKSVVREILMIILLTLVIVITLKIVIYDFIPNKKKLPQVTTYIADGIILKTLNEIESNEEKNESILKSYTIEESDLKGYVLENGKLDPFGD